MKRRALGALAVGGAAAFKLGTLPARAADASLLTTTLTPMGAERAGNADGSIPAWTGGYTTIPAGWQPGQFMPDVFASEQPLLVINASNMSQHADKLTDGIMALITRYNYSLNIYPTHRTAAAPQSVYDNIAKNVATASLSHAGGRLGFQNAFGGTPFPIPDISTPLDAGAQIIWNHNSRWIGYAWSQRDFAYVSNSGDIVQAADELVTSAYPYYAKDGSLATFDGVQIRQIGLLRGPPQLRGEELMIQYNTEPYVNPNIAWEVLAGQGRVRKAPEIQFDTPASNAAGNCGYDEFYGFVGSLEKYDWTYIGKKEMYIPYNNNAFFGPTDVETMGPKTLKPEYVRWELHRVWIVEATLHPGERNVLARRRFYVDEDTWIIANVDAWDANNNLFKVGSNLFMLRPDLPGVVNGDTVNYNLQNGNYARLGGMANEKADPTFRFYDGFPNDTFDPQSMAASSEY